MTLAEPDEHPPFVATGPLEWKRWHSRTRYWGPSEWMIRYGPGMMDWACARVGWVLDAQPPYLLSDVIARFDYEVEIETAYSTITRTYHFSGYQKDLKANNPNSALRNVKRLILTTSVRLAKKTHRIIVLPNVEDDFRIAGHFAT